MQSKGMVVKIKKDYCVVVNPEGNFAKIPVPKEGIRVGQEISYTLPSASGWLRYSTLVASFLVIMLGLAFFNQLRPSEAVTYVSLDINPSMELALDDAGKVIAATGLNADGQRVLKLVKPEHKAIRTALDDIITKALELNYLKTTSENLLVLSVTKVKTTPSIPSETIQDQITTSLERSHIQAKVVAYDADPKTREAAIQKKLSTGKMLIYQEVPSQKRITINQLRKTSVAQLTYQGLIPALDRKNPESKAKTLIQVDGQQHTKLKLKSNGPKPSKTKPDAKQKSGTKGLPTDPIDAKVNKTELKGNNRPLSKGMGKDKTNHDDTGNISDVNNDQEKTNSAIRYIDSGQDNSKSKDGKMDQTSGQNKDKTNNKDMEKDKGKGKDKD